MNRASSSKRQRASFAALAVLGVGASLALQTVHAAPSDDWKVARDNVSQDFPTVGPIPTSAASAQQIHAVQSANSYIGSIKPNQLSSAVADAGTAYPSVSSSASAKSSSSQNDDSKQRTAAASASQSSSSAQADTTVWKWDSGAFGCQSGTPSGTAAYCRETGVPVKRAVVPMDTPLAERMVASDDSDSPFEDMWKRQDNDDDNNNNDTNDRSGNGGPPSDINNVDSPDLGWLDLVVGGVPYKNGDLAPSIVWILAVLLLLPLFLIRLIRRSSLIAHVLFTVFVFGCVMIVAFGMRAWLSNNVPTTTLMIVQNVLLQIMPPLLLEPLLNLLAMYSTQGGFPTGVPRVALFLRFINVVALVIFSVAAAYTGVFLNDWDKALKDPGSFTDQDDFPSDQPNNFVKVGPIVGSFMMLVSILGGLLLIPIARGESGSMRPGGFLGFLLLLLAISVIYRVFQTLHAKAQLDDESGSNDNPFAALYKGNNMADATVNAVMSLVQVSAIAPPGMYSPDHKGIDWQQLQQTLSSRGVPQTPVIFNVVYVFPMWLQTFLLFFVHAPGHTDGNKLQAASVQP